jgi:hypothetical protein
MGHWAAGQERAVEMQQYPDSSHVNDRDNGIFQVPAPILFRVEADRKRVYDFRTMESTIAYVTIICPCVKCSTISNML